MTLRVTLSRVMMSWGGDLHDFLAERDADDLIERPKDEDDSGAFSGFFHAAEAEDDAAFVLLEDLDGVDDVENQDREEDKDRK